MRGELFLMPPLPHLRHGPQSPNQRRDGKVMPTLMPDCYLHQRLSWPASSWRSWILSMATATTSITINITNSLLSTQILT